MPLLKKEYIEIEKLKNWEDNPRTITKERFEDLKVQIQELGEYKPLIVNSGKNWGENGVVIGGNMRLRAYQDLGFKKCWISWIDPKNEEEALKYALSDNDQAGDYHQDDLANYLSKFPEIELKHYSINLGKHESLNDLILDSKEIIEDEPPAVEEGEPDSKLGEVYQLGRHRLMAGDATKIEDVEKLMNGQKCKTLFTSPPYNMGADMYENYDDNLKSKEYIDFNLETIHTWLPFIKGYLFWNISYNKNSRWEFLEIMYRIIKETGLRFLEMIVWDKGHGMPITSKDMLTREYEDILFLGKEVQMQRDIDLLYVGTKYNRGNFYKTKFTGHTNYWRVVPNKVQRKDHLAIYPVMIPAKGILLSTERDDIVTDPFGGSGSTLIACEQTDRTCYMMELEPHYCDVIRKRYAKFIGKEEEWQTLTSVVAHQ